MMGFSPDKRATGRAEKSQKLYKLVDKIPCETDACYLNKTALIFGDPRLTFAALDRFSNRVNSSSAAKGLHKGDRVTLYA